MKFEIDAKEFKKAADRAMAVVTDSKNENLNIVKITAVGDVLTMSIAETETFVDIYLNKTHIVEGGEAYISQKNLRKIYGLSGYVTIETGNGIFSIKNARKCCDVPTENVSEREIAKSPIIDDSARLIYEEPESKFISSFVTMDCMRSRNWCKPVLTGFNIDTNEKRIVVCDGTRIAVRTLSGTCYASFKETVPGSIALHLKKIGDCKSDSLIKIYHRGNNVIFEGSDYKYVCRIFSEKYINVAEVLDVKSAYHFEICPKELEAIAKEYSKEKIIDGRKKISVPMCIIKSRDAFYTAMKTPEYRTADFITTVDNVYNVDDSYCFYADPNYIKDAMSVFRTEKALVYGNGNKTKDPIVIEDGEYKVLVMPMFIQDRKETETVIREFISKI